MRNKILSGVFAVLGTMNLAASSAPAEATRRDYPIQPVPFTSVRVADGFWSPRMKTNREVTVWYDFKKCEETGRIDNFSKAAGQMPGEFRGIPYDDSDVYKVIEGAAYCLAIQPDPKLDKYLDELIARIAAAQEPDGYLYTARRLFTPEKMPKMSGPQRWSNLPSSHELYNVGHLYEAAVAHWQATGKRSLLDVAIKNADMLCTTFGPGKLREVPGHQKIEMGLVRLYRATGNEKYLQLARFYVAERGNAEGHKLRGPGQQDHAPILQQEEAVGHAVRAGYFYSGAADVAAITGEAEYIKAIDRIWENVVFKKLYLTGGIGARHAGEAFGDNYELPNRTAYNETCAAIANALWNHRMFLLHGDGKYIDVFERILYNGFLSGVSFNGDSFFYPNPLEVDGKTKFNHGGAGRQAWFGTSCCPVNVVRFIPAIAGCVYATRDRSVYVNLYVGGQGTVKLGNQPVQLTQETRYPWDGKVRITLGLQSPAQLNLRLRIPGWATGRPVPGDLYRYSDPTSQPFGLTLNGQPTKAILENGFAVLSRAWKSGDVVELELPMPVRRVLSHPAVKENTGRIAVERGPIVFCAEGVDNNGQALRLVLPDDVAFTTEFTPDLLNGVMTVQAKGQVVQQADAGEAVAQAAKITLVPYYAWCHRGPGEMNVWLARNKDAVPLPAFQGSASHTHSSDSVDALSDGRLPKSSADHGIPRFTWWDHRGTPEWVQYDFYKPRTLSKAQVYWFDDTGRGDCRVPQSWKLLYKDGDAWKEVPCVSEYGTKLNTFNSASFSPITTRALRLQVQLQPRFSGGILEWKVE